MGELAPTVRQAWPQKPLNPAQGSATIPVVPSSPGLTAQGHGGSGGHGPRRRPREEPEGLIFSKVPSPDGHVHPFLFLAQILLVTRELIFTHKPGNNARIHRHQNTERKKPDGYHTEMGKNVGLPLPNRYVCECVCM